MDNLKTRLKIEVAYDGTDFCGWQSQRGRSQKPSLCETLSAALEQVLNHPISLFASGRTDAGVHARAQITHLNTHLRPEQLKSWDLCWAVRRYLPKSLVCQRAWIATPDFHATHSALGKTYKYFIWNSPRTQPHLGRFSAWIRRPLDVDHLNNLCGPLVGCHDFKSFQTAGSPVPHTRRRIFKLKWRRVSSGIIEFSVTGNGFLKQMVRNIVGTQLSLQKKGETAEDIDAVLKAMDRRAAGPAADPEGLFLWKVHYPPNLDKACIEI